MIFFAKQLRNVFLPFLIYLAFALYPASALSSEAEIISIVGKGDARASSAEEWKAASVKQRLNQGTFVRTRDLSQMALLLQDQTQLRINQNSMVQIKEVSSSGETTKLELTQGRVWAQAKRKVFSADPSRGPAVTVETPNAVAAIRGTDWEMVVDKTGAATLTVLSGEVEFYNDLGRLSVRPNEQAKVEPGKAPTKILLTNARERVQWVTAYRPQPERWLRPVPPDLRSIVADIEGALYGDALTALEVRNARSAKVDAALLLADLYLSFGRVQEAVGLLERHQDDPLAVALLARAYLIADRFGDANRVLLAARAKHPDNVEVLLAQGDLSRFDGDAAGAKSAYQQALALAPDNADAWFGVGRVDAEREAVKDGLKSLNRAIAINPVGAGYQGELGTLKSFANEFDSAEKSFHDALAQQPDDYVSLTGLGILQLKRGDPNAALESFLKSGVIEPRYARGALYTGVAYYQLGNYPRAMEMFWRAAELDPRDPMPHMMMSMAATDRLDFGAAIAAARRAAELMPYLKSLNQLLNDHKGNANIGTSLARFGMEDWSQAYAHNSYTPYWAGSHLFLADRYSGDFNKNSELFLGFLSDPTVFGASNRFNTMVASPGYYAHAGGAVISEDVKGRGVNLAANGYSASSVPFSYFASAEPVQVRPGYNNMQGNGDTYTIGLGARPTHEFSTFLFANNFSVDARNTVTGDNPLDVTINDNISRVDLGASYKFSPASLLWLKAGHGMDAVGAGGSLFLPDMANYFNNYMDIIFEVLGESPLCAQFGGCYSPNVGISRYVTSADQNDIQLRHTFDATADWQISWGGETGRQQKPFAVSIDSSLLPWLEGTGLPAGNLQMRGNDDVKTAEIYASSNARLRDNLRFQADLSHIRLSKRQWNEISISAGSFPVFQMPQQRDDQDVSEWNPRLGVAWNPVPDHTLRVAAQVWRRPASVNTLAPVDTVGIPVDDRLVALGGRLQRIRAQYELEMNAGIFVQGFVDSKRVSNLTNDAGNLIGDFGLTDLKRLRNVTQQSLAAQDVWEATPGFGSATVDSASVAVNRLFSDTVSGSLRYDNNHSRNTGAGLQGNQVPWLPRHIFNLVANWMPAARWQLGAISTYRSSRYQDEANTQPLAAGWNFGLRSGCESIDKSWAFEVIAKNLHANKKSASAHSASLTAQMLYRF